MGSFGVWRSWGKRSTVATLLEVLSRYSGLTSQEYAEMLGRPIPSVRRDLIELRRQGAVVSHKDPELSRDCGHSPTALYWHDVKCDVFVEIGFQQIPNVSHASNERGWVTHRVTAHLERTKYDVGFPLGSELGRITISHIPQAAFEEHYPDVKTYVRVIKGVQNPTVDFCDDMVGAYRRFREFHVESVHVAFVEVHAKWRRRLIALTLYHEAARWMGQQEGLPLAASDNQTREAKALWNRLEDHKEFVRLSDGRPALSYVNLKEPT